MISKGRGAALLLGLASVLLLTSSLTLGTETETNIFLRGAEPPRPVLNIAHAGASSLAPQNTLTAGKKALQTGADLWGADVRLTEDGFFILMHDESLRRTTNVEEAFPKRSPWLVEEFTLAEVKELDAGSWFANADPFNQIEEGRVSPEEQQAYIGERVPTLREALEFTRKNGWRMDIEVKPMDYFPREEIALKLVSSIEEARMEGWVMVSSFDHQLLRVVKSFSDIPTAALFVFAPADPIEYLEELGADAYQPSPVAFRPSTAAELTRSGYGVYVWTYNQPHQLRSLAAMEGVSGIYTDFPQRLEPILDQLFGPDMETSS